MITVIATGFDGGKKRQTRRGARRPGSWTRAADGRAAARARLPRGAPAPARRGRRRRRRPDAAATARATTRRPRRSRSRGSSGRSASRPPSAPDDLRRRRPRDPELPPPEVSRAGRRPATRADDRARRPHRRRIAPPASASSSGSRTPARAPGATRPSVTLVAVSKTVPPTRSRDAVAAGLDAARREPGPGGAMAKAPEVPGAPLAPRRAAPVEQGAPGARGVRRRSSRSTRSSWPSGSTGSAGEIRPGGRYPVLLQVNVDDDPAKAGFAPERRSTPALGRARRPADASRSAA